MLLARILPTGLMQAAALQDTIVTLMVPQRDMFDWVGGVLQLVGWVLTIALLARMVMLLVSVRATVNRLNAALIQFGNDTRPLIHQTTAVLGDAREVIAMVRTDVARLGDTAGEVGDRLRDAVEATTLKVDEVSAVIDVLQAELERTAIGAVSTARGLRVAAGSIGTGLLHGAARNGGPRTSRTVDEDDAADYAAGEGYIDELDEFDEDFEDELDHEVERALDTDLEDLSGLDDPRRA